MNKKLVLWVYLINAIFLINHEIDSAFWQEWKLINPGDLQGINGFLIIHFVLLFIVLLGFKLVNEGKTPGYVISLFLSTVGVFAFVFHFYLLFKGRPEFNTFLSKFIIIGIFVSSVTQGVLSAILILRRRGNGL